MQPPETEQPDDLLTIEQAAALLGKAANTVRMYLRQKRLVPAAGTEGRGHRTLLHRADVEALGDLGAALTERRRERREAMLAAGGRVCRAACGRFLTWEHFEEYPAGVRGRHSRCLVCRRTEARDWAQKHQGSRRA